MVQAKYPRMDLLTTGHSLGAGLATLVSGLRKLKSISFSDPGTTAVLKRLHQSCSIDVDRNFVFADEWDPVYRNSSKHQVVLFQSLCLNVFSKIVATIIIITVVIIIGRTHKSIDL